MRISMRSRYGLRAMLYVAAHGAGRMVPLSEIATCEGLPAPFLERIAADLRRSGLLRTRRGVTGGYALARSPRQISAADVVIALDGPLSVLACIHDQATCKRADGCRSREAWSRVDRAVATALAEVTLQDLMEKAV